MRTRYLGLLGLIVAVTAPAVAQQPPAGARPGERMAERRQVLERAREARLQAGPSAEAVLRLREQLNLTDAQVNRLEVLRQEGVAARRERMAERLDLQSQLQAGRMTREQLQERLRTRADQAPSGGQAPGERVRAVLTDQQRLRLAELQVEQLRRQMQAQRGGRQLQRGGIGRGMGPGQRPMLRGRQMGPQGPRPGMELPRQRLMERRMQPPGGPGEELDGLH